MTGANVRLDHAGIEVLLKEQMRGVVVETAERMAEHVKSQGIRVSHGEDELPVKVVTHVSDRVRAVVLITHPAALAVEAKHGVLAKAAAAVGLEVTSK